MPFYRVEIRRSGEWTLLHGRVEARNGDEAVAYVRLQLPKKCEGHHLRAKPTVASKRLAHLQRAAEG